MVLNDDNENIVNVDGLAADRLTVLRYGSLSLTVPHVPMFVYAQQCGRWLLIQPLSCTYN